MKKTILASFLALTIGFVSVPALATYEESSSENTQPVSSISLKATSQSKVEWSVEGYSKQGFKVVWSKNQGPTYPTRDGDKYHYYSSPSYRYDVLEAFSGEGTYYVRVCEYLGGACGVYSNEITLNIGSSNSYENKNESSEAIKTSDGLVIPAGYEKIPNIESIKYYKNIKKIGDTDLYGIKIIVKIPEGKEWIKSLADIKYFKNIEKIGDNLYGTRISDEKKLQIQKKINELNSQIKKLQEQLLKLTKDMAAL